jgi:acetyl esterase/lipase
MHLRTGVLTLCCWLVGAGPDCSGEEPPDAATVVVLRDVRYREGPSPRWRLDLAMSRATPTEPRPGVVVIHGGGWREGDKSSFATPEHGVPGNIVAFAEQGYVAAAINYRLSGDAPFPAALEDCRCAVRWLRAHARQFHLNPDRVGAFGNSAGGHLALLLGMAGAGPEGDGPYPDESSLVQAVVSDSGPVDLIDQYERDRLRGVVVQFLGGPPEGERVAAYRRASPRHQVAANAPPVLLIYGGADEQVPVETADRFVAALAGAGNRDVSFHRLAGVGHCPYSLVRVPWLQPVVNDFFARTLFHPETAGRVRRPIGSR